MRALYAIPYPGSPTDGRFSRFNGASQEGCLVIAASDKTVKFHEVWSRERKSMVGGAGLLGGSDILEYLEGIDKEGDVIR
jgi:meiosis-specific APC/C activator protein AMA1